MVDQVILTKKERKEIKKQNKKVEHMYELRKKNLKKHLKIFLIIFLIALSVFGLWKLSQQPITPPVSLDSILQVQSDDWVKGNTNATVTIIEYLDFECEACGAYYPLVKRILEEYNEDVLFVSRYFPLSGHKNSMTSALAVEAAGKQGKYWEMHDLVFEKQREWGERKSADPTIFEQYAKQLNLDMDQFNKDVNSNETKSRILRDKNLGIELGIDRTPTFFLGGKKIENPRGYEAFKFLIDNALNQ